MLDNLRAMGVFAYVVERGSFSKAAKELGITTSAVSQQIRSLEQEMNVTLMHRSTRRISLTEAGQAFYQSCQEMVAAAERGKIRINELQDDLVGELRIASTPEIAAQLIVPALSHWMMVHTELDIYFDSTYQYIDLKEDRIDIAIRMSPQIVEQEDLQYHPIAEVDQVLLVSPSYCDQNLPIKTPQDLVNHNLIAVNLMPNFSTFQFTQAGSQQKVDVVMPYNIQTNNVFVAKALCQNGLGVARILFLDAQRDLQQGDLIEVLTDWKLPKFVLYAVTLKRDYQPIKIQRCLETLRNYFAQLPGGR